VPPLEVLEHQTTVAAAGGPQGHEDEQQHVEHRLSMAHDSVRRHAWRLAVQQLVPALPQSFQDCDAARQPLLVG
jgi:hypothetical protein